MSPSDDHFLAAAKALRELQARDFARLLVGTDNAVQVQIHRTDDAENYLTRRPGGLGAVKDVADEVAAILTAIVSGVSAKDFARQTTRDAKEFPILTERYALVAEQFPLAPLRRRAWLKRTTKNQVARFFDWEVAVKTHDSTLSDPTEGFAPLAFGTIRLTTESSVEVLADRETAITVDEEDVAYLLESLQRLQACMRSSDPNQGS